MSAFGGKADVPFALQMSAFDTKRTLRDQFSNAILHSLSDRPLMTQSRHYRASRIYLVFAGGGRTFTGTAAGKW